jgi:hypothetical protein
VDDFGQYDDDDRNPRFARSFGEQPWLRQSTPPWHMWGNQQEVVALAVSGNTNRPLQQQLLKISYKRPETWHWLFSATLLEGPQAIAGFANGVVVTFDLTVGIGRTSITMPAFETFQWSWVGPLLAPVQNQIWSTQARAPNRVFFTPTPAVPIDNVVDQIVAEDIQLGVSVSFAANGGSVGDFRVLVAAQFAPKSHVRPDWFLPENAPLESVFPGDEIGGR